MMRNAFSRLLIASLFFLSACGKKDHKDEQPKTENTQNLVNNQQEVLEYPESLDIGDAFQLCQVARVVLQKEKDFEGMFEEPGCQIEHQREPVELFFAMKSKQDGSYSIHAFDMSKLKYDMNSLYRIPSYDYLFSPFYKKLIEKWRELAYPELPIQHIGEYPDFSASKAPAE